MVYRARTYRNGNYSAFYVAEPFNESNLGANATKDFVYYNLLRAWKGADSSFPFIDSHNKNYNVSPDYSWDMLIRASNPAFSCGRSPVSLEPLSIRLNRLKNRAIEPVINRLPARGAVTRRQVDFPARNPHRLGPFHGPDSSFAHYPGAQDTRASLFHNRFQSVAP